MQRIRRTEYNVIMQLLTKELTLAKGEHPLLEFIRPPITQPEDIAR